MRLPPTIFGRSARHHHHPDGVSTIFDQSFAKDRDDLAIRLPGETEMGARVVQELEYQDFAGPGHIAPEVLVDLLPGEKPRPSGMGGSNGSLEIKNRTLDHL